MMQGSGVGTKYVPFFRIRSNASSSRKRSVLDRVDAGADRPLRSLRPVGVRRRLPAQGMRLVHQGVELGLGELR